MGNSQSEMRVHPSCFVLFTLFSLAVVAEDQWAETSTLSAPDARKIPQIVQLAEKAFRLVKPLADQTNVETNTPLNENSASPGQTSSTVLAQAAREWRFQGLAVHCAVPGNCGVLDSFRSGSTCGETCGHESPRVETCLPEDRRRILSAGHYLIRVLLLLPRNCRKRLHCD